MYTATYDPRSTWLYLVEILEMSVDLGHLSRMPSINDTAPWVLPFVTMGGTSIPKGWAGRPPGDGWHWQGYALDQGGYGETELANFWYNNRHRGVIELIHNDGTKGWLISHYNALQWSGAWGHWDHVHVAMGTASAKQWRDQLAIEWEKANEIIGGGVFLG